jgi:hypothetical protein
MIRWVALFCLVVAISGCATRSMTPYPVPVMVDPVTENVPNAK